MKILRFSLFALLFTIGICSLGMNGCQKEMYMPFPSDLEKVNASVIGTVVNAAGEPVTDAQVLLGNESTTSDANGHFLFKNIDVNVNAYVRVKSEGYFHGSHRFYPKGESTNQIEIQLQKKDQVIEFSSSTGGEFILNEESKTGLNFPENAFVDENQNPYNGDVQVFYTIISSDDPDLLLKMPGDLVGNNIEGKEVVLASYGMIGVELYAESGMPLQIASGKEVTMQIGVPEIDRALAPSVIPLWYFDETIGIWIEEGQATFDGEKYIGKVTHFSFWNCDDSFELVQIEGCVNYPNGSPGAYLKVQIESPDLNTKREGRTDENGVFRGKMPKGEVLQIKVYQETCDDEFYSAEIGPFSNDLKLPAFSLKEDLSMTLIEASISSCSGENIENGIVNVKMGNREFLRVLPDNGHLSFETFNCNNDFVSIQAFDLKNATQSTVKIQPPGPTILFGNLEICESVNELIKVQINNEEVIFILPELIPNAEQILIRSFLADSTHIVFRLSDLEETVYDLDNRAADGYFNQGVGIDGGFADPLKFTILDNGAESGYLSASFFGTYIERKWENQEVISSQDFPVTGTLYVAIGQ